MTVTRPPPAQNNKYLFCRGTLFSFIISAGEIISVHKTSGQRNEMEGWCVEGKGEKEEKKNKRGNEEFEHLRVRGEGKRGSWRKE